MAVCCLPFISSGCKQSETAVKESSISDALYQNLPFEMPKVQQPVFPAYEVNIEKFGAKGDGLFLNTKAINDAIKDVNQHGGGKVIIPEGIWLTGPIELLSNVNLYTKQNALVLFTGDFEAYPIIATSFEGLETRRCQSPISARNAENIAITGHGTFDGNGDCWRPVKKEADCFSMEKTGKIRRCSRRKTRSMVSHCRLIKRCNGLQRLQCTRRYQHR